ncbi:MAG: hypothetical protein KAI91_00460, partial [Candidatus Omnitrophica bacterium]|nr:hypothetical protein [Candidatus Omnitrophota bacterium]
QSVTIVFEKQKKKVFDILKRPKIDFKDIKKYLKIKNEDIGVEREIEIQVKYEGFLKRELNWLKEMKNLDKVKIPKIDYAKIPSLSTEIIEKLREYKPVSLGQALRISGVTPAAIFNVYTFIKKKKKTEAEEERRKTGDRKPETEEGRRKTGDRKPETEEGRRKTGDSTRVDFFA